MWEDFKRMACLMRRFYLNSAVFDLHKIDKTSIIEARINFRLKVSRLSLSAKRTRKLSGRMQNALPEEETNNSKKAIASVLMKKRRFLVKKIRFSPTTATRNVTKFTIYLERIVRVFRLSHQRWRKCKVKSSSKNSKEFSCNKRSRDLRERNRNPPPPFIEIPTMIFSLAFPPFFDISMKRRKRSGYGKTAADC